MKEVIKNNLRYIALIIGLAFSVLIFFVSDKCIIVSLLIGFLACMSVFVFVSVLYLKIENLDEYFCQ
jgi:hypothetical protein